MILYLLALVDFACTGIRTAAGRSSLLDKYDYYNQAIKTAVFLGHIVLIIPFAALMLVLEATTQKELVIQHLQQASNGMFAVYIPYALVYCLALLLRAVPLVDFKSCTSILLLGPMTFFRPAVAILGILMAVLVSPHAEVFALAGLAVTLMLLFEFLLEWLQDRKLTRRIAAQLQNATPQQDGSLT